MNIDMKYTQFLDDFNKQLNGCSICDKPNVEHFKYAVDNIDTLSCDTHIGIVMCSVSGEFNEMTVDSFNQMLTLNPKAKDMCKGSLKLFLKAYIEYRKAMDYYERTHIVDDNGKRRKVPLKIELVEADFDGVEHALKMMNSKDKIPLHKPCDYSPIDGAYVVSIEKSFTIESNYSQIQTLKYKIPCIGLYNGRVVLCFNHELKYDKYGIPYFTKYYVAMDIDKLCTKVNQYTFVGTKNPKTKEIEMIKKEIAWPTEQYKILRRAIVSYAKYIQDTIKERIGNDVSYNNRYIMFEETTDYDNERISGMIRELWDVKLGGLDARTGTSLTDSYMTMLGWYFSPVDKKDRYAGSFVSPVSGIGKTAIMEVLCKKTDVVHSKMSQVNGSANQFSFATSLGCGPDILRCDDPMNGTDDILNLVSVLVSNKEVEVEFKGKDRYPISDLFTKVLITSNVPLHMKNDCNNFMTKKLFELQTNDMESCDDAEASRIVEFIDTCKKWEINNFLSKCVKMYNDNPGWIQQHIGQYVNEETKRSIFAILSLKKIRSHEFKTLIQCVYDDCAGYDPITKREDKDNQMKYQKMCKYIKIHYPTIAKRCKCSVPRNNLMFKPSNRPSPDRCQNYMIDDDELYNLLIELKSKDDILESSHDDEECGLKQDVTTLYDITL